MSSSRCIQQFYCLLLQEKPRTGGITAHIVQPMKIFTCTYMKLKYSNEHHVTQYGECVSLIIIKTTCKNMKRLQIKFSSQFLAILLLMQTRVKSKKTCKPGQEDVTSQPFD